MTQKAMGLKEKHGQVKSQKQNMFFWCEREKKRSYIYRSESELFSSFGGAYCLVRRDLAHGSSGTLGGG